MTPEDIKTVLKQHKLWLKNNSKGARADLSGANLREVDLREVDLREVDLSRANLREVDLRWADLRWADLSGVDLRGANLLGADLGRTNLRVANLLGAVGPAGFEASDNKNALLHRCATAGACASGLVCLWGLRADITLDQAIAVAAPAWAQWLEKNRVRLQRPPLDDDCSCARCESIRDRIDTVIAVTIGIPIAALFGYAVVSVFIVSAGL